MIRQIQNCCFCPIIIFNLNYLKFWTSILFRFVFIKVCLGYLIFNWLIINSFPYNLKINFPKKKVWMAWLDAYLVRRRLHHAQPSSSTVLKRYKTLAKNLGFGWNLYKRLTKKMAVASEMMGTNLVSAARIPRRRQYSRPSRGGASLREPVPFGKVLLIDATSALIRSNSSSRSHM